MTEAEKQAAYRDLRIDHSRLRATETPVGPNDRLGLDEFYLVHGNGESLGQIFLGLYDDLL